MSIDNSFEDQAAGSPFSNITVTGTISAAGGTSLLPSYTFTDDPNTGIYRPSADALGFATGGIRRLSFSGADWNFNNTNLTAIGSVSLNNMLSLTTEISTPSTPSTGGAIFLDSADGDLKIVFASGNVVTIAVDA